MKTISNTFLYWMIANNCSTVHTHTVPCNVLSLLDIYGGYFLIEFFFTIKYMLSSNIWNWAWIGFSDYLIIVRALLLSMAEARQRNSVCFKCHHCIELNSADQIQMFRHIYFSNQQKWSKEVQEGGDPDSNHQPASGEFHSDKEQMDVYF